MKSLLMDPNAISLNQAQQRAWLYQQSAPETMREALGRLQETTRQCREALENGQLVSAQTLLEDAQLQVLIAMKTCDVQPESALQRALNRLKRLKNGADQRAFHIYADHVEIKVGSEVRGEWPLYAQQDYDAALRLAHELGCAVIHEEAFQLGLFEGDPAQREQHVGSLL